MSLIVTYLPIFLPPQANLQRGAAAATTAAASATPAQA